MTAAQFRLRQATMRLLVLTLLVCVAVSADTGGRVRSSVNSGVDPVVPNAIGGFQPVGPRGGVHDRREYERGSGSSGHREHHRQGSSGEFDKGGSYKRDKIVREKEQGSAYDHGRGRQGSESGRSGGRSNSYDRERSDYGRRRG